MRRVALAFVTACAVAAVPARAMRDGDKPAFDEIAAASGLTVSHVSSVDKRYILESMSGGAGLVDYDNDGDLDVVLVNGSTVDRYRGGGDHLVTLYEQKASLAFSDVTERAGLRRRGWGMGVAAADVDNDGWIDLYVTGFGGNALYRNRGDGTFEDVTERAGVRGGGFSAGAAWADYDRDGDVDLFVARYVSVDIDRLPEFGKDEFCRYRGVLVQCGPVGLPGETDLLFRNKGDGTFEEVSARAGVQDAAKHFGLGAIWTDYDDDGWVDLFVANDATPNYLYRNRRDGTFEDMSLLSGTALDSNGNPQGCMGVDAGDVDRDGKLDLLVTNFSEQPNALYRNLGRHSFTDLAWSSKLGAPSYPLVGWGTALFDYNSDGWLDVFVANGHVYPQIDAADVGTRYRQPPLLHRNRGDATFDDVSASAGFASLPLRSARGAAFGDLDSDGDLDIVVVNLGEPPTLLRNRTMRGRRVLLELVGTSSNRTAAGARVTVRAGTFTQISEVHSGVSYLSHNDVRVHVGLGEATRVDSIEVRWPNGTIERLGPLDVDRQYRIEEGKGVRRIVPFQDRK
jgi:enediyne biosynthesis protein E4